MALPSLVRQWSCRFFAPETMFRQSYEAFRDLLDADGASHDLMAELEQVAHGERCQDWVAVSRLYDRFSGAVGAMVDRLRALDPVDGDLVAQYYRKIDFYSRFLLAPPEELPIEPLVLPLSRCKDRLLCGNKAFNLAVLEQELEAPVPAGIVFTTHAYHRFLARSGLRQPINDLLARVDITDSQGLEEISGRLISLVRQAGVPPELSERAREELERCLGGRGGSFPLFAVRSSAVGEDGAHSFAGQYTTVLGVSVDDLTRGWREVIVSKYTPQALHYRISLGMSDEEAAMAVLVLPMIDAVVSGVLYTRDPGRPDCMAVQAVQGLGDTLVSGQGCGMAWAVDREKDRISACRSLVQGQRMELGRDGVNRSDVERNRGTQAWPGDDQILELARWGRRIESHFGQPQDIEWAIDRAGNLVFLQARPLHLDRPEGKKEDQSSAQAPAGRVIVRGGIRGAGGLGSGRVVTVDELDRTDGPVVLVTRSTPPSLAARIHRLSAVVAEQGSSAGHFATVCREFGVPLLVQVEDAVTLLPPGREVSVDADQGIVYAGMVTRERETVTSESDLPLVKKLRPVMSFITPLNLVDPYSPDFRAESCRSLHDIIRYTHERAIQTMFSLGCRSGGQRRQLATDLPLVVNLLDLGDGLTAMDPDSEHVTIDQVVCRPFLWLWRGLSHPGIDWHSHSHFDWKSFDELAMAGGMARQSGDFASWAIVSRDYLNLNMRFGYHFTLVDSLWSGDARTSYCQLRFAGGGGDDAGRFLRLDFVARVLERLGFAVRRKADLLDARLSEVDEQGLAEAMEQMGRLLGATKLLDMVLRDDAEVETLVGRFFQGEYRLGSPGS